MQYACTRWVSCNCGVWIREGNNVVEINMCTPRGSVSYPPLLRRLLTDPFQVVTIQQNEYYGSIDFKVFMPSGLTVRVYARPFNLNIYISFHEPSNINYTGFCFVEESNFKNYSIFEVPRSKSYLYSGAIPTCNNTITTVTTSKVNCFCLHNKTQISEYLKCRNTSTNLNFLDENFCNVNTGNTRRRRDSDGLKDNTITIQTTEKFVPPRKNTNSYTGIQIWPTPISNITFDDATKKCMAEIKGSPSYNYCKDLNITFVLETCLNDIQASESYMFLDQIRGIFENNCIFDKEKNVITGRNGNAINNTEIFLHELKEITNVLCVNNCSRNGVCKSGICTCTKGTYGDDCSVTANDLPIIHNVLNPVCDIRVHKCNVTLLHASKIISGKTKCQIRRLNTVGSELWTKVVDREIGPSTNIGFNLQRDKDDAPSFAEYSLTLSNDGENFTTPVKFFLYDSYCRVFENQLFTLKDGTCEIEERCFKHMDFNPMNSKQYCNSKIHLNQWTNFLSNGQAIVQAMWIPVVLLFYTLIL